MPFYTTEECATYIKDYLWMNRANLTPTGGTALKAAFASDERIIPKFPCVLVVPGPIGRELVQTGMQAEQTLRVSVYIMHAKLTQTRERRTQEDIQMSRKIVQKLHQNRTLDGNVIVGFVEREDPGALSGPQGLAVVGTSLLWRGTQREHIWES